MKARWECSSWCSGLRMKTVMVRMMVMVEVMRGRETGDLRHAENPSVHFPIQPHLMLQGNGSHLEIWKLRLSKQV